MDAKIIADWIVTTALMFGASVATAYQSAGLFVAAIEALPPAPSESGGGA